LGSFYAAFEGSLEWPALKTDEASDTKQIEDKRGQEKRSKDPGEKGDLRMGDEENGDFLRTVGRIQINENGN